MDLDYLYFNRLGYHFRYFFDCDVDGLGHVDVEGFDVYDGDTLISEIDFITREEIEEMDDETLLAVIMENYVNEFGELINF